MNERVVLAVVSSSVQPYLRCRARKERTAACVACGAEARFLFHVKPGTTAGDRVIGVVNARVGGSVKAARSPWRSRSLSTS